MLKALAENQEDVWKQIWIDECDPQPIFPHQTPSQIKTEIESLMSEVMSVEKAIGTLLNLKQKQANIMEAQFAREQSEETARQSVTIMVFTVVTILFVSWLRRSHEIITKGFMC